MTTQTLALAIADGNKLSHALPLPPGKGTVWLNSTLGQRFILTDAEHPGGPARLRVKRVGNTLEIALPDEENARLVINDFYSNNAQLQGLDASGEAHTYVPALNSETDVSALADDQRAFVVMDEKSDNMGALYLPQNTGAWQAIAAFIGLLGLGGIARSMQNQHSEKYTPPPVPEIVLAQDDVGIYTGSLSSGGLTDSARPEFNGHGNAPGSTITLYADGVAVGSTLVAEDGSWAIIPENPLSHGQHAFTATETYRGDGAISQPSAKFDLFIDLIAPETPTLSSVVDAVGDIQGPQTSGQPTNDPRPVISGSAEPGSRLIIMIDGVKAGEVLVDASGHWQWQPDVRLAEGERSLTTYSIDPAGNIGLPSSPFIINVDTIAPTQPAISQALDAVNGGIQDGLDIGNGGLTNDNQPVLNGRAEAGSLVRIYNAEGEVIASVTAGSGDSWSIKLPQVLPEGENILTVTATDDAGNISLISEPYVLIVDTIMPDQPAILQALDAVDGGIQDGNNIGNGGLTNDNQPVLNGRAEAGSLVRIYNALGEVIASVKAGVGDSWSVKLPQALPEGENTLTVTTTDDAGNISLVSEPYALNVDTFAPDRPTVLQALDAVDGGIQDGNNIGNGGLTNDNQPVLNGRAESGSLVRIYNALGEVIASVKAGVSDSWSVKLPQALPEGENTLTVTATDDAGNISLVSEPYTLNVDTLAPDRPTVLQALDAVDGGIQDGNNIGNGGLTNDNQPILNGRAEEGSLVRIYNAQGQVIASVKAGAGDNWSVKLPQALPEGKNTLTVTTTDDAGNISLVSEPYVLNVDTLAPDRPAILQALDNVAGGTQDGNDIGNGGLTNDNQPVLNGRAEEGSLVRIYNAQGQIIASVTAGPGDIWSIKLPQVLPENENVLTLTATDSAGNISAVSAPFTVNVDTIVPDNSGQTIASLSSGMLWNGSLTNDSRPQLSGSGEKGATVTVYQNGLPVGTVLIPDSGEWVWRPDNPLADNSYEFNTTLTDKAGNVSEKSGLTPVTIDTTPPAAVALIDGISRDSGYLKNGSDFIVSDNTPGRLIYGSLSGAVAGNERIQISVDGGLSWHDTSNDPKGGWYWFDDQAHAGNWQIQTRVIDPLARTSATQSQEISLDTTVPDAPFEATYTGQEVTVNFSGGEKEHGGQISIKLGENYYLFGISDADVEKGFITVTLPDSAVPDNTLRAAIVNQVGKTSEYRSVPELKNIDFNAYAASQGNGLSNFAAGTVVDGVRFNTAGHFHKNDAYTGGTPAGWVLHFFANTTASMDLNRSELGTKTIEFSTRMFTGAGTINVQFFGKDGNLLGEYPPITANTTVINRVIFSADEPIYNVTFRSTGGDLSVFDFAIYRSYTYADSTTHALTPDTEFLIGTDTSDVFNVADVADLHHMQQIGGGGGIDTLRLTGADQVLDFTQFADKINSVEIVDITGSGNNTLLLSLGDILAQGSQDLFHNSGNVQMMVRGDAGDVVNLSDLLPSGADSGDWNQGTNVTIGGVSYQVWEHSGISAELLVQANVVVNPDNH